MSFWVYIVLVILALLFISGESSSPLGSEGRASGCVPGGCFVRLAIMLLVLMFLVFVIQFLKSMSS